MKIQTLLHTIIHLRPTQVFYQIKNRLIKPAYVAMKTSALDIPELKTNPVAKYHCNADKQFSFLNLTHEFAGWNYTDNGMLWAYNQNYFDWINQENITQEEGCIWIDRFIEDLPYNKIGLDPYPTALRSINWIKLFCRYSKCASQPRLDSLYSQLRHLEQKLEYHLLGNHLLEDAYALYIGSAFFNDMRLLQKAEKLLLNQLQKQILPDGAHYEQSPMYHCIMLDRLLDCINIRETNELVGYAQRMLGHLESIIWQDGAIPMLNDSANGIAPTPAQLFDYAKRLGLQWQPVPLKECGYRKFQNNELEAIVDVGNITATYQPGHSHADTFNFELRVHGKPFIVDTGISTYNKTDRRQLERSTIAHNCVSLGKKNSSEVWGGFRVGRRCKVTILEENTNFVIAKHNGFGNVCRRKFEMTNTDFSVEDWYDGDAVSYIHLAKGVDEKRITIEGALKVETKPWDYSVEYNQFIEGKVIEIIFKEHCKYIINIS